MSNSIDICRTCLKIKPPENCKNISPIVENDNSDILEMLSYSIPELDIFLVVDPVICDNCITALKASFKFKLECIKNEEKLLKYSNNATSKVDLRMFKSSKNILEKMKENNNNDKEPEKMNIVEVETTKIEEENPKKSPLRKSKKIERNVPMNSKGCLGCKMKIRDPSYHSKVNIGPFVCYTCNKEVNDIQDLRKHILGHVKPRSCKICHKMFRDLECLRRHFRVHTQVNPYTCKLCQKQFRQKHNLSQHLNMHLGSENVSCKYCNKVFSTKYNAKVHMQNSHRTKEVCDLCGQTFCNKAALVEHLHSTSESCGSTFKERREIKEEIFVDVEGTVEDDVKIEPETDDPDAYIDVVF
ncbi:uncharacterized protein [Leptinotarsa decemlineata]|uniref:uncharacterized protein n=1 Tax=Leptinotarsa decemlineata TaxID=7539 RepID=UPI003D308ABC